MKSKSETLDFSDKEYFSKIKEKKVYINHIHWDGSILPGDLFKFYKRRGIKLELPESHLDGKPVRDRKINSVEELENFQKGLLTRYDLVNVFSVPVGAMQTKEDLHDMAVSHCSYLKSQNVVYAETRFAPFYHTREGLTIDDVIIYSLEGFSKGFEETGVRVNPIICINREISSEESKKIIKSALKFQGRGIVGVDLACYEPGNPPEKHKKAIEMTFDSSLKRTFHVGEMCGEEENLRNIETVLNNFRPHGISHAVDLWRRNDLIDKLVENKIRLESNPISNYNFFINKLEDLHLDELMKKSVLITINPDDPMMWPNGEMVHNLYQLGKIYGNEFVEKALENAKETAWN